MAPRKISIRYRRGITLLYAVLIMTAAVVFVSFAVDYGRIQMNKSELQAAADSAARQGAMALQLGYSAATTKAITAAGYNKVDNTPVVITSSDVEFGLWNPDTRTFTALSGSARNSATTVRVTARRTAAKGNALQTGFTRLLGFSSVDVTVTATATRGKIVTATVDGDMCPWLAGMPSGSKVGAYDGNSTDATAPNSSPLQVGIPIIPGASIYFRQTTGQTSYANASNYGPDGNIGWIVQQRKDNGINATSAPLNSLVGIFLDNNVPTSGSTPAMLDFSSVASRDFSTLTPGLKQVFFIGDGMNSSNLLQEFKVPTGATRLYLGIMDEKGWWWDNTGYIETTTMNDTVQLVE